jgi:hypothetical protein
MQPAPARLRRCQSPLLTQEIEASHERDLRRLGAAMLFDHQRANRHHRVGRLDRINAAHDHRNVIVAPHFMN